jgi:serpin B
VKEKIMSQKFSSLIALLAIAAIFALASDFIAEVKSEDKDIPLEGAIVRGNMSFSLDLYSELKKDEGNLFFSPYSISTALAMTYAGARGNTEKQMAQTLHFAFEQEELHPAFASIEAILNEVQEKGGVQLTVANALWPQKDYPFRKEYLALIKKYYGASITPLDFKSAAEEARQMINDWVEEKTKEKIKNLIPKGMLDRLVRLVLTNAIYFKGNWASQFDKSQTKEAPFYLSPGKPKSIPMMHQKHDFGYAEHEDLQILKMSYVGDDLSMLVLLPKKSDGLKDLEKKLTADNLKKWTKPIFEREVIVFFPKFEMTSQFNLAKTLSSMGMPEAFSGKADFSGMSGTRELFISEVVHKAFIAVDEQGTEAAAATGVVMKLAAIPSTIPVFKADHPFLFLIRDNITGSILFMGRVLDPTA